MQNFPAVLKAILASWLLVMLCSCSAPKVSGEPPPLRSNAPLPDFSGNWEKSYQLSDDFNNAFRLYIADLQRLVNSPQSRGELQGFMLPAGVSSNAINGLARFAEELTRMPLLDIQQTDADIRIDRELDFTLRCHYADRQYSSSSNVFGSESCGWNTERLMFYMKMSGLAISHQFSMSPDGSLLNITTTVSSDEVSAPLIIKNFYRRYNKPEETYNCLLTLTRSKVCTQNGEPR